MGVYTYTMRTKTVPVELSDGKVIEAHVLAYLCRSGDHDRLMFASEPGYRRKMLLLAAIAKCRGLWVGAEPIYFVLDHTKAGWDLFRAESPGKVAVWHDCDDLLKVEGVTKVGRLGERVRRGRRVVWPLEHAFAKRGFPEEPERLSGDYFPVDADDPELELGRKD